MGVKDFKQIDGDIYIDPVAGDFVMVDSDNQHILDILQSYPGWWKNSLTTGAGIPVLLKSKINAVLTENVIKQQLEADGYQVTRPYINIDTSGKFTIQPNAIRL